MAENWSLNVALTFDKMNPDSAPGESVSDYAFEVSISPLIHFPLPKLEILAGPILGTWVSTASASAGSVSTDVWGYGWTIGGNVGVLVPVGSKVELGGLLTLSVRNVMKLCTTVFGNETCASSGVDAAKALGLAFAAMF